LKRWYRGSLAVAALVAGTLLAPGLAHAQADADAQPLLEQAFEKIRFRKYGEAVTLLKDAQRMCRTKGCAVELQRDIYLAQGIAMGLNKDGDEARKRFEWALSLDPASTPDERFVNRAVATAFEEAKENVAQGQGAQPPQPPGALSEEQKGYLDQAKQQLKDKDWKSCMETMIVATTIGDFAAGKLMLAKCQAAGGLLREARKDAEAALELARGDEDVKLEAEIREYLQFVDGETPKIRILNIKKVGIRDPSVLIDGQEVPTDMIEEPIPSNPGSATITIKGKRGGEDFSFSQEVRFERREVLNLDITKVKLESPFEQCMRRAKTPREETECRAKFGVPDEDLNFNAALEVASYNDTDHVDVLSPSLSLAALHPTQGWNFGGSALVDVVTTASADIVATASRRFDDLRFAGSLGGGYRIGPVTAGVNGSVSAESDYIGRTVGASLSTDLFDKMVTPTLSYSFGFDLLGRSDTDFDVFSRDLYRHTINLGTSVIFGGSTVGAVAATAQFEDGDSSKPYRHVALFSENVANSLPEGASPELVHLARLDLMPFEQLPTDRQRYALLLRGAHRFETATLRGSERVYVDSWGVIASSTDVRFLWDIMPELRVGPHARFHIQGGADFWERAYTAPFVNGVFQMPALRTGDRELGPMLVATGGSEIRYQLTELLGVAVLAEAVYTHYMDHLYIWDKVGLFTASTLELAIE
jgi:tetratricopeptide (TPR) repeat protein